MRQNCWQLMALKMDQGVTARGKWTLGRDTIIFNFFFFATHCSIFRPHLKHHTKDSHFERRKT